MGGSRTDIWITDLVSSAINGKVSPKNVQDYWRSIPYRLEGFSGTSLAYSPYAHPEPLTLCLGATGIYKIYLVTKYPIVGNFGLRVKLTNDLCFETLNVDHNRQGYEYPEWWITVEVFWKEADLTGQDLIIAGIPETWLWAIRLEPVEKRTSLRKIIHPYVFTDDGDMMGTGQHRRKEDILEREALIPENTCAKILIYSGINFDVCNFPTKVGTIVGASGDTPTHEYSANIVRNMEFYAEKGLDPLALVRDYARSRGWEFHVYVRLRALSGVYPYDGIFDSRFFIEHPEYHLLDKEGTHVCGMSYAYPEVREHVLALYKEILSYGVDSLCLCFVRGCPLVLYEPIMVKGFQERYGLDPRKLEDTDERWLDYCTEVNTDFMREVKALARPGQSISGLIHGTKALNRRWGMDIPLWIREGLINDCYIIGHIYDEHDYHWDAGPEQIEYDWFQNLPGREKVRLFPMLYPWDYLQKDPAGYQKAFWSWLDQGADGYGIWDGNGHLPYEYRELLWNIGFEQRKPYAKKSRLTNQYLIREINGFRHDRYSVLESW